MNWLKNLLRSKKFWTMVASIVAALAAFFATSCASMLELRREGLHHDTVEYRLMTRSKKMQAFLFLCSSLNTFSFLSSPATPSVSAISSRMNSSSSLTPDNGSPRLLAILSECSLCGRILKTSGPVPEVRRFSFPTFGRLLQCSRLFVLSRIRDFQSMRKGVSMALCTFPSRLMGVSLLSLALMLPVWVPSDGVSMCARGRGRRRGKGRPRPGIISIPLGGKHL